MAQQKPIPPTSEPVQQAASSSLLPSDWQSADFIRALASLERLQNQLDQVRRIPANMVSPFQSAAFKNHHSPQQVFTSFNTIRQDSFRQINNLKQKWDEPQNAQLFQQCNSTKEKHVDLVKQYGIGIWGWIEREEGCEREADGQQLMGGDSARANGVNGTNGVGEQQQQLARNTEEDEKTACALFGPEFEQFERDDKTARVQIVVRRPGPWLRFKVQRIQTADGVAYEARCMNDTKEAESISRCLYRTVARQDVFATLETLLAYGDPNLSRADCAQCGRYRDGTGMIPSVRRRSTRTKRASTIADDTAPWVALHEGCL